MKDAVKRGFLCACLLCVAAGAFPEKISFSADSMNGVVGDKSDSTELRGNAYVLTESMEISADSIKMEGKEFRYIEAAGAVKGKNSESELEFECGKLRYDRETKVAELFENVNLIDVKNNVNATAQMIEYRQNTDIAIIQINIELKQKDNICNGAYAVYRKKEQLLDLSGNAQIKQGDDTFRAQAITLNLDTQEITLDGHVKGSVIDERKTDSDSEKEDGKTDEKTAGNGTQPDAEKKEQNGAASGKDTAAKPSGKGEAADGKSGGAGAGKESTKQADDKSAAENGKGDAQAAKDSGAGAGKESSKQADGKSAAENGKGDAQAAKEGGADASAPNALNDGTKSAPAEPTAENAGSAAETKNKGTPKETAPGRTARKGRKKSAPPESAKTE